MSDDGGPAFPGVYTDGLTVKYSGMPLRDYMAAAALTGILSPGSNASLRIDGKPFKTPEDFASAAYAMADAMIAARGEK